MLNFKALNPWSDGVLEYWSVVEKSLCITPLFQHSNTPISLGTLIWKKG